MKNEQFDKSVNDVIDFLDEQYYKQTLKRIKTGIAAVVEKEMLAATSNKQLAIVSVAITDANIHAIIATYKMFEDLIGNEEANNPIAAAVANDETLRAIIAEGEPTIKRIKKEIN